MIRNEDTPPPPYSLHGVSDSGRGQAEPATFAGRIQSSHASDPGKKAGLKLRTLAAKLGCGGRDSDSQRADSELREQLRIERQARIDRQARIGVHGDERRENDTATDDLPLTARGPGMILG